MTTQTILSAPTAQAPLPKSTSASGDTRRFRKNSSFQNPTEPVSMPEAPAIPRWKRVFDVTFVLLLAPLVAPIMAVVALLIRCVSPGPIFFRQSRVGYQGKEFNLMKFRTMSADADAHAHHRHLKQLINSEAPMTKLDAHDPRVILGGRWLRATGLDELPQLLNVLRGEMSLVGPRPCTPYEFAHYTTEQRRRFGSLPGLTGLWQVNGKNRTTFQRMVELDVRYVQTASIWLDLWILAKTPLAILTQVKDALLGRRSAPVPAPEGVNGTEITPVES